MRKVIGSLVLGLCLVVGGCDAGEKLEPADLYGDWALQVDGNSSCSGAAGANTRYFTIDGGATSGGVLNVVEEWDFVRPYRTYGFRVTGNINIAQGTVELNFWHTVLEVGAVFTGTIDDEGRITGVLRDPKPGYRPHVVLGSCTFSARGGRVGP